LCNSSFHEIAFSGKVKVMTASAIHDFQKWTQNPHEPSAVIFSANAQMWKQKFFLSFSTKEGMIM